jgi:hypothetical protein
MVDRSFADLRKRRPALFDFSDLRISSDVILQITVFRDELDGSCDGNQGYMLDCHVFPTILMGMRPAVRRSR